MQRASKLACELKKPDAAEETGRRLLVVNASSEAELETGLSKIADARVSGVVVQNDPFFDSQRDHLIQVTAQRSIPAIYHIREFPVGGGLMSYGQAWLTPTIRWACKSVAFSWEPISPTFPSCDPLTLGLNVPASLWAQADEVIE
jgi:hypothetical protein